VIWLAVVAGGPFGVALAVGALVLAAVVAARILLGVLAQRLGGFGWAGTFLLGGVVVPLLVLQLRSTLWPALTEVLDPVLLTGVVAVQAGILAHLALLPRDDDLAIGGGSRSALWPGVAALTVPVMLSAGAAVLNPLDVPSLRSNDHPPAGGAVALAWPAGQHPVIATTNGARFCDTDLCDRYVARNGGPAVMGGRGTAGVGPDGVVVRAAVTGSEEGGGPFIHYARCTRDGCPEAWLPVRASAAEPFGWPELAVAGAPDGALWFALAMPSSDDQYRISFIRCADTACARPQRHQAGTLERTLADGYPEGQRARLTISADGRPTAAFWIGWRLKTVTCEPVTCAGPRQGSANVAFRDAVWATPPALGAEPVLLMAGRLRIGDDDWVPLEAADVAPRSGAVAVAGSRVYATVATATGRPPGFHLTVGAAPGHWQQMLWICERSHCRRHPLDVFRGPAGRELLAVGPDGRVLIVRDDLITLTTLPAPDS
jgi:hypothetical protein